MIPSEGKNQDWNQICCVLVCCPLQRDLLELGEVGAKPVLAPLLQSLWYNRRI